MAKAVAANQLAFATVIAPGFHGLLPAGELMALRFKHLQFNAQCGVGHQPSMQQSWSALRLSRGDCGARCPHFTTAGYLGVRAKTSPRRPCLAKDISVVQARIQAHVLFFGIISQQFKPYSLRRGGATFLLQAGMPLESILLRGRWKSLPSGDSTLRTDWRNSRRCALLRRCNCELLAGRRKLLPRPFGHNFWGRGTRAGQ